MSGRERLVADRRRMTPHQVTTARRPDGQFPIDADLASMLPFELRPVPRIANVDRDTFEHVVRRADSPMILEGVVDDWEALERWTTQDRFAELIDRDEPIRCRRIVEDAERYTEDFQPTDWGTLLDQVYGSADSDRYLTQALVYEPVGLMRRMIRSSFPGLLQDLFVDCKLPAFVRPDEIGEGILWVGSTHQVTPLHFDPTANINCTLVGRKRWILFPPDEAPNLMVGDNHGLDCMLTPLDELIVDGRWIGGPVKRAFEVFTEPGDTLYLPAGWQHHVISPDELTIAVNFWYVAIDELSAYWDYARLLAIDQLGFRPRIRRRLFSAAAMAGVVGARVAYAISPRLLPMPDLAVGAATYDHTVTL